MGLLRRRFLRQVLLHLLLVQAFILPPQAFGVWLWRRLLRKVLLLVQAILPPSEVRELWVWRRLLWKVLRWRLLWKDLLVQALFLRVRRQVLRQVLRLLSGISLVHLIFVINEFFISRPIYKCLCKGK